MRSWRATSREITDVQHVFGDPPRVLRHGDRGDGRRGTGRAERRRGAARRYRASQPARPAAPNRAGKRGRTIARLDPAGGNGDPEGGYFTPEQGRTDRSIRGHRPITASPSSPRSSQGGRKPSASYGKTIEEAVAGSPDVLAVLKLHYLRWVLFDVGTGTHFMYQGIFDTDFDKYTEDAIAIFTATGINTVFENLVGFPEDWKTNAPAFVKFVRDHQRPSFLEYAEYPYVTADEVKKALRVKAAMSTMLDQMQ